MNIKTKLCSLLLVLMVGCTSQRVSLEVEKKLELPEAAGEPQAFTAVNWNSNFLLASAFLSGHTYLIDPDTGQRQEIVAPPGVVDPIAFASPRSSLVAIARYTEVKVYDADELQRVREMNDLKMHSPPMLVKALSLVSRDGHQTLILAGDTKTNNPVVVESRLDEANQVAAWSFPASNDTFHVVSADINPGPQRNTVAMLVNRYSPRKEKDATIHDLNKEFWIGRYPGQVAPCVIRPLPPFRVPYFDSSFLHGPILSPDGQWVVFTTKTNAALSVYDTERCKQIASAALPGATAPSQLAFSPDGKWLVGTASTTSNQRIENVMVWSTKDWSLVASVRQAVAYQPSFSKDSKRLAVGTTGGIYIYRLTTDKQ